MTRRAGRHSKSPKERRSQIRTVVVERQVPVPVAEPPVNPSIATGVEGSSMQSILWPELEPKFAEMAEASGKGESVKKVADFRLEAMAVGRAFPIHPEIKARLVYEATVTMLTSKDPKVKLRAMELIRRMEEVNLNPRILPQQVNVVQAQVTVVSVLKEHGAALMDPRLDLRDIKIVPGGADDYAD